MKPIIDATAVYYDGNANGKIDGYYNEDTGVFVVDAPDRFITYLTDGDYEETQFRPVVDASGVHQYFMRPYYTANPVCLVVPTGHSETERMQVMPNFVTDVPDFSAYEALSAEQNSTGSSSSGRGRVGQAARGLYRDNHYKYTRRPRHTANSISRWGDTSPAASSPIPTSSFHAKRS